MAWKSFDMTDFTLRLAPAQFFSGLIPLHLPTLLPPIVKTLTCTVILPASRLLGKLRRRMAPPRRARAWPRMRAVAGRAAGHVSFRHTACRRVEQAWRRVWMCPPAQREGKTNAQSRQRHRERRGLASEWPPIGAARMTETESGT